VLGVQLPPALTPPTKHIGHIMACRPVPPRLQLYRDLGSPALSGQPRSWQPCWFQPSMSPPFPGGEGWASSPAVRRPGSQPAVTGSWVGIVVLCGAPGAGHSGPLAPQEAGAHRGSLNLASRTFSAYWPPRVDKDCPSRPGGRPGLTRVALNTFSAFWPLRVGKDCPQYLLGLLVARGQGLPLIPPRPVRGWRGLPSIPSRPSP
jgi:hypothetical protein